MLESHHKDFCQIQNFHLFGRDRSLHPLVKSEVVVYVFGRKKVSHLLPMNETQYTLAKWNDVQLEVSRSETIMPNPWICCNNYHFIRIAETFNNWN